MHSPADIRWDVHPRDLINTRNTSLIGILYEKVGVCYCCAATAVSRTVMTKEDASVAGLSTPVVFDHFQSSCSDTV